MDDLFPHERQTRWVAKASRAPSAHNTQPARWRFTGDGSIYLFEDRTRQLHVADPQGHDQDIALGAAFEGMCLAASEDGLKLAAADFNVESTDTVGSQYRVVARTRVQEQRDVDDLAQFIDKRATYRGRFLANAVDASTDVRLQVLPDTIIVSEPSDIETIADVHDVCASKLLQNDDYYAELYNWLRFNPRHSGWDRDGLSAMAMSMGSLEKLFGPWFAHPLAFRAWRRLGLAKMLISEKPAVCSASALLIFVQEKQTTRFDAGRAFYRLWLTITGLGLVLCPMSALVDYPDGKRHIEEHWPAISEREIINVFRVGRPPPSLPRPAARLPVSELILD